MTRSVFIRRTLALVLFLTALSAWALLAATFVFDLDRSWRIAAVFAAAFSTEAFMWVGAALLGWKAFESRAALWRKLTGTAA